MQDMSHQTKISVISQVLNDPFVGHHSPVLGPAKTQCRHDPVETDGAKRLRQFNHTYPFGKLVRPQCQVPPLIGQRPPSETKLW